MEFRVSIQGLLVFLLLDGILAMPAFAREDLVPGSRYTSAQGAAMGDAALPMGDDVASGLFYNPADLGKIRKSGFEPINMSGYVNGPFIDTATTNSYQVISLPAFMPNLQRDPGQMVGVGGQFLPTFGFPNVGFGILGLSQIAAQANSDGTVTYRSVYQIIPAIGTGFKFFNGVVRVGYSLQWVNEAVGTQTAQASTVAGYNQNLSQGSGFSNNFGLAITAPMKSLPSLNFVVRNAFNTYYDTSTIIFPFSSSTTGSPPPTDLMSFDGSFSLQPRLGRGAVLTLVVEDRDITNTSGMAFLGHFAAGAEINLRNKIFLRGGWGSGYPSAGFGFRSSSSDISFAWYSEEIGTGYLSQRDIRYMMQYQIKAF